MTQLPCIIEAGEPVDGYTIVFVGDPNNFAAAHLPGAHCVQPAELVSGQPPATGRLPDMARLEQLFSRLGHDEETRYLVYDDEGGGWAGRFAWTLDAIRHPHWAYLNGGIYAWHGAGLPLDGNAEAEVAATQPSLEFDPGPVAEMQDVLDSLDDPETVILDVRSAEEYAGTKLAAQRGGHIPGAVNMDWLLMQDRERETRLIVDLEARLAALGVTKERTIITHCQTHHRSGLSYMALRLLGFPHVRAYHGSWSEWGNHPDTPIETTVQ